MPFFIPVPTSSRPTPSKPIKSNWVIRILLGLVIVLSVATGFFQLQYRLQLRRYNQLEKAYQQINTELEVIKATKN